MKVGWSLALDRLRAYHSFPISQIVSNASKLFQRRLQILHYVLCYDFRIRQVSGVLKAFVLQPENVKTRLVTLDQFVVLKRFEPL